MRDLGRDLLFQTMQRLLDGGHETPICLEGEGIAFDAAEKRLLSVARIRPAAQGISLILGPNGAGKSLLIRVLHGLIRPTRGQVRLNGQTVTKLDRQAQAMVFQKPVLLRRSVEANLTYAMRAKGIDKTERAARMPLLLEIAGLAGKEKQKARTLSGGEEQCLALAAALSACPKLLFLDEPTSSLDPSATHRIETVLRHAATLGVKVIMVTHDLAQAARLGDEILFFAEGRVVEQLTAEDFFNGARSAQAQSYLMGQMVL